MILGVTGGMGCGKSTVGLALAQRGFQRLDSDQIVRDVVLNEPDVISAIHARFGDDVVVYSHNATPPRINRPVLANRVFSNEADRRWLEELIHPRVYAEWRREFAAQPKTGWAVEVPLLHEQSLENWFDFTVCVACAPALQLARLEQRGFSRALAGQRISKQLPLARKIELSDFVLWNEGSPAFLGAQVDRLADALAVA